MIQPPNAARPAVALFPPVTVCYVSETSLQDEYSMYWMVVTLVDVNGVDVEPKDLPSGELAASARPMPGSSNNQGRRHQAYFYFPNIVIPTEGCYKLRMSLYDQGTQDAVAIDILHSHEITVNNQIDLPQPSKLSPLRYTYDHANF